MLKEIVIDTDYIKLDQFLKYSGVAQTGGHSKFLIKNGDIKINDEVVFERGKKVRKGDKVEITEEGVYIVK